MQMLSLSTYYRKIDRLFSKDLNSKKHFEKIYYFQKFMIIFTIHENILRMNVVDTSFDKYNMGVRICDMRGTTLLPLCSPKIRTRQTRR